MLKNRFDIKGGGSESRWMLRVPFTEVLYDSDERVLYLSFDIFCKPLQFVGTCCIFDSL